MPRCAALPFLYDEISMDKNCAPAGAFLGSNRCGLHEYWSIIKSHEGILIFCLRKMNIICLTAKKWPIYTLSEPRKGDYRAVGAAPFLNCKEDF